MKIFGLSFLFLIPGGVLSASFCYDDPACGPDTWSGPCHSGTHQSPIHIRSLDINGTARIVEMKFNEEYSRPHEFYSQNNGHTIQLSLDPALGSNASIRGYEMEGREYIFAQMHFHWGADDSQGSEHKVNGMAFSMEAHLVHYSSAYSSFQAAAGSSGDPKSLGVVGVFLQATSEDFVHQGLQGIIDTMSVEYQGSPIKAPGSLVLGDFLPHGKYHRFFRYQGSLTTPPCTEEVLWTVFKDPLPIAPSQVEAFRKIIDHETGKNLKDNARPVQPLNERVLEELVES